MAGRICWTNIVSRGAKETILGKFYSPGLVDVLNGDAWVKHLNEKYNRYDFNKGHQLHNAMLHERIRTVHEFRNESPEYLMTQGYTCACSVDMTHSLFCKSPNCAAATANSKK